MAPHDQSPRAPPKYTPGPLRTSDPPNEPIPPPLTGHGAPRKANRHGADMTPPPSRSPSPPRARRGSPHREHAKGQRSRTQKAIPERSQAAPRRPGGSKRREEDTTEKRGRPRRYQDADHDKSRRRDRKDRSKSRSRSRSRSHSRGHSHDRKMTLLKSSAGLLVGIGVTAVVAHKLWPKGVMYGDKEAWERTAAKKLSTKRDEVEMLVRGRRPDRTRVDGDGEEEYHLGRRGRSAGVGSRQHGNSGSRHGRSRPRRSVVNPYHHYHDDDFDGDKDNIDRGEPRVQQYRSWEVTFGDGDDGRNDHDAWRGWDPAADGGLPHHQQQQQSLSYYDDASIRREMRENVRAAQRLASAAAASASASAAAAATAGPGPGSRPDERYWLDDGVPDLPPPPFPPPPPSSRGRRGSVSGASGKTTRSRSVGRAEAAEAAAGKRGKKEGRRGAQARARARAQAEADRCTCGTHASCWVHHGLGYVSGDYTY